MNGVIKDIHLGDIIVKSNARARKLTFRGKPDSIQVTVPIGTHKSEVLSAIEKLRPKLTNMKERVTKRSIDLNYRIDAEFFKLSLSIGQRAQFLAHSELGKTEIICPPNTDFENDKLQEWLQKVIAEALRKNAKIILPQRLNALAAAHHFTFKGVKINSSEGRWGSCSSSKSINLSYYLILLPAHLLDYVLLHELCHTIEMNHGPEFWKLLNRATSNKALALREELKKYKTGL